MASFKEQSEAAFVKFIFTRLQELLEVRLVSSEDFRWLPTAGSTQHDQKPDLIVLHPAFYTRKTTTKRPYVCGVPSSRHFFKELKLIDVKLSDPTTAFGEHVIHQNHLYNSIAGKSGEPIFTRGAVADQHRIRLVECFMRAPVSVISVDWTSKGGAKAVADFFKKGSDEPEKTVGFILDKVCTALNVSIVESQPEDYAPCFLGAGAMGKVFKVQGSNGEKYALKIVLGESDICALQREHKILQEICDLADPTDPITVKAENYCVVDLKQIDVGAGLLMTPIGTPLDRNDPNHFHLGLMSLGNLKLHKLPRYHGDARAANMLLCNGRVILCDLRDARQHIVGNLFDYQQDIAVFVRSFDIEIDSDLKGLLDQYNPTSPTAENCEMVLGLISAKVRVLLSA